MCPRAGWIVGLIAVLCGLSTRPSTAADSPDAPLLRRIPGVAEGMAGLTPFLRDTELQLHVRSYCKG
jgi:hypothetical protein